MKRLITLTAAVALMAGLSPALAQATNFVPGEEFMTMWDIDSDGKVTLAEAREKRTDIFAMFDSDDNGSYSADELKGIDEHKQMELEAGMGPGHNQPAGMQPGQFQQGQFQQGQGMGRGPGMGQGRGPGQGARQNQMAQARMNGGQMGQQGFFASAQDEIGIFDANRDGTVSRTEFIDGTDAWFAMRDSNRDGALTVEDFGPRR